MREGERTIGVPESDIRRNAEDSAEDIDEPLVAIEAEQHARRAPDPRLVDQQLHVHRHGVLVGQVEILGRVKSVAVLLERPFSGVRTRAFHVEHVVHHHAIEPGAKAALALERGELREHLEQHFLCGVLRVLREVHHPQRDVIDPRLMPGHELVERRALAADDAAHEVDVVAVV